MNISVQDKVNIQLIVMYSVLIYVFATLETFRPI